MRQRAKGVGSGDESPSRLMSRPAPPLRLRTPRAPGTDRAARSASAASSGPRGEDCGRHRLRRPRGGGGLLPLGGSRGGPGRQREGDVLRPRPIIGQRRGLEVAQVFAGSTHAGRALVRSSTSGGVVLCAGGGQRRFRQWELLCLTFGEASVFRIHECDGQTGLVSEAWRDGRLSVRRVLGARILQTYGEMLGHRRVRLRANRCMPCAASSQRAGGPFSSDGSTQTPSELGVGRTACVQPLRVVVSVQVDLHAYFSRDRLNFIRRRLKHGLRWSNPRDHPQRGVKITAALIANLLHSQFALRCQAAVSQQLACSARSCIQRAARMRLLCRRRLRRSRQSRRSQRL